MVSIPSDAIEQTLVYKETEQKSIELIWRAPTNRIYEKAPVFLVIPGGGWRVESKTDMLTLVPGASETLRERGWAVVSIDYRVIPQGVSSIQMLSDCCDACRYLAHFADELGLDRDRFVIGGHSAGGHLALMVSLAPHSLFTADSPYDVKADDFTVVGSAPMSPLTTLCPYCDKSFPEFFRFGAVFVHDEDTERVMHLVSPIDYLTPASVPVLLMYGSHDSCVSPVHSLMFLDRAKLVGAPVTPVCSAFGDHCFESFRPSAFASHPDLTEMQPILADWVDGLIR